MGSRGAGSGRMAAGGSVKITKAPTQKDFDNMPTLQREKVMELQNGVLNSAAVENPQFAITKDDVYIAFTRTTDNGTSVVGIDKAGNVDLDTGVPDFRKKSKAEQKKIAAEKAETNRILNQAYVSDKTFVKGSKANRIALRQHKRRRS